MVMKKVCRLSKYLVQNLNLTSKILINIAFMDTEQLHQVYLQNRVICTDTRQITPGCLFFALRGENFDGNLFAEKALDAGAAYAVIDNETFKKDNRFILVDDVLIALQNLARHHRRQLKIPFIGITGSNGKTTTKELLHSVLSQHCRTHATTGNLNNHIGVPLTILSIPEKTDIAIIEMGANHQKEIEFLCSICQPTHGIITNVGKAHLEGFGGVEGVKKGKGELYEFIERAQGTVFVNSDNYVLVNMLRDRKVQKIVQYGTAADNFVSGSLITNSPYLNIDWHRRATEIDDQMHACKSNLTGTYNFENIMAAICIGIYFKLSAEQVHRHPVGGRRAVGQHQDFRRAGDHVDAHRAEHALLGAGDVGVAGAGDLVHLGHRRRAVGQRGHGLSPADGEGAAHAGHIGGGQHPRIFFAPGRGHDHDDLADTGHMGGNGVHQHRRRIRRLAAGHIDADAVERRDLLAQQRAVLVAVAPAFAAGLFLRLVVSANPPGSGLQGISLGGGNRLERGFQFGLREFKLGHRSGAQPVKAGGVLQHGRIAALLHIGQDVGHPLFDLGVGVGRPVQPGLELSLKFGFCA